LGEYLAAILEDASLDAPAKLEKVKQIFHPGGRSKPGAEEKGDGGNGQGTPKT
jgi:hypothetical protein